MDKPLLSNVHVDGAVGQNVFRFSSAPCRDGNSNQHGGSTGDHLGDHHGEKCIVQFLAPQILTSESDTQVEIFILRRGKNTQEAASVDWRTRDSSAVAGVKYEAGSGTLHFPPGKLTASCIIQLIDDDNWDTVTEFTLELSNPVGCFLSFDKSICIVKIVDNDTFPGNKYSEQILKGEAGIESIPGLGLMLDFIHHCMQIRGVGRKCAKILIFDQMHNLYYLIKTYLVSIYMVDVLFQREVPESELWLPSRGATAQLVAVLFGAPMVVLHFWDLRKALLDVGGELRAYLQMKLFAKYLEYDIQMRAEVPPATVGRALLGEVQEIVSAGFLNVFGILAVLGKLAIVIAFVLHENKSSIWVALLFPVFMAAWVVWRNKDIMEKGEAITNKEKDIADTVEKACNKLQLILDYSKRVAVSEAFGKEVENLSEVQLPMELSKTHNKFFPTELATAFTVLYICLFSRYVMEGDLSLGTFLAMVKVFSEFGKEFAEAYEKLMELSGAIGPLKKVTTYMNGHTDLDKRLAAGNETIQGTLRRLKVYEGSTVNRKFEAEIPALEMNSMRYDYRTGLGGGHQEEEQPPGNEWSLYVESVRLEPGVLVSVVGPQRSGKATLMKILSGILCPNEGGLFIPSYMRCLHVSQDPMLFDKSLWGNLNPFGSSLSEDRILRLLQRVDSELGLVTSLEKQLNLELADPALRDGNGFVWRSKLSCTEQAGVHLARALLFNPDLLIIEHPCKHFDRRTAGRVINLLRAHVDGRGLEIDERYKDIRMLRTVVYTTDQHDVAADVCLQLHLDDEAGLTTVRQVKKAELLVTPAAAHPPVRRKSMVGPLRAPDSLTSTPRSTPAPRAGAVMVTPPRKVGTSLWG